MSTTGRIVASIGGGLQVVGVALVFWEIWGIQRLLNKRTWTRAIVEALTAPFRRIGIWLKARGRPKATAAAVEGSSLSFSGNLSARLIINEPVDAPIEQRIDIHRRRLDAIDNELQEIRGETMKLEATIGLRFNAVAAAAMDETKRLREVIDQLGAGSLGIRAAGGALVLVGSALWVASEWL